MMAAMADGIDPILERVLRHLPLDFDLMLATLKGHLLIEEQLDNLISSQLRAPQALKDTRLPFDLKVKLANALTGEMAPPELWTALNILNKLRNSLAHRIEDPKLANLVRDFVNSCEQTGFASYPDDPMDQKFTFAIAACIGFLAPEIDFSTLEMISRANSGESDSQQNFTP